MPEPNSGCFFWLGHCDKNGYGQIGRGRHIDGVARAHVAAYEIEYGPVPAGLQLDHKCRVRCCVNPRHLEAVTQRVNILRGESIEAKRHRQTHCKNGHELSGGNLIIANHTGHRRCRICTNVLHRQCWARRKAASNAKRRARRGAGGAA